MDAFVTEFGVRELRRVNCNMPEADHDSTTNNTITESIEFEMFCYPTGNPTWIGNCKNSATKEEMLDSTLQFHEDHPYTGDVHETLTRSDLWDQVNINIRRPLTLVERETMITILEEAQKAHVDFLLQECSQFYPELQCREEAAALIELGRGYEALVKIMAEGPPQTNWSIENRIGTWKEGQLVMRPIVLAEAWNLKVGNAILREAIAKHLERDALQQLA